MTLRRRLVIADDYRPFVDVCRGLLEPEFEVLDVALNGRDLLVKVSQHRPDAVVLDVFMPIMNGLHAAEQIKLTYPEIQLIFLTADPRPSITAAAMERGASAVILKGDAEELRVALRTAARAVAAPVAALPPVMDSRFSIKRLLK